MLGWQLGLRGPSVPLPGDTLRMELTQRTVEDSVSRFPMSPFEPLGPAVPAAPCHSFEPICLSQIELEIFHLQFEITTPPHICLATLSVWPLVADHWGPIKDFTCALTPRTCNPGSLNCLPTWDSGCKPRRAPGVKRLPKAKAAGGTPGTPARPQTSPCCPPPQQDRTWP